jgi:flavorubredoxin
MITEIAEGVYWVGVVDWGLRHFHGHELSTFRGSSYNAYLVVDEKVALVDTVWEPFRSEFLANVREVIDPARIDYVITNHAEPDHSGTLADVLAAAPNARLVVSRWARIASRGTTTAAGITTIVRTGDRISLGARDLVFMEAPLLHWPDSMFTYLTGSNVLMPNDAFGQHYATAFRFNDRWTRTRCTKRPSSTMPTS